MPHDIKIKIGSNQMLRKHLHLWQDSGKGAAPLIPGQPGIPEVQMLLEKARGQNQSLASLETVKPDSSCLQPLPDLSPESQHTPRRSPARVRCQRQLLQQAGVSHSVWEPLQAIGKKQLPN